MRTARLNFGTLGAFAKEVWRLLCCGGALPKYVLWKAEEKWRAKGWGLCFGGQHDGVCALRGMMWADNYWLFGGSREEWICMVNDIIGELLDLDMEPKPESLWWRSTYKNEDMRTFACGRQG